MSDAHRGPTDHPPRPPWETDMTGVRCPACGLGGDVPGSVVRTLCPRCGTEFDVLSALASRPRHGQGGGPSQGPSGAPIPLGPATSGPAAVPRAPQPEPDADAAPAPPPPAPPPPAPPPTARTVAEPAHRVAPDAPVRPPVGRLRAALVGVGLFGLGVLVGWVFTRVGDEGSQGGTAIGVTEASATRPRPADGAHGVDTSADTPNRPSRPHAGSKRSSRASASSKKRSSSTNSRSGSGSGSKSPAGSLQEPDGPAADPSAPSTTRRSAAGGPSTTTPGDAAPAASTTVAPASPAVPLLPASRACSGLDCHMTGSSGVEGIPLPDDAIAITRDGASGWTTQVASLEDLTTWYLDHLTDLGWVLDGPSSVMDPSQGAERGLGHATSAVYCPTDPDHRAVAVNVGWPAGDDSGATVVLAIVTGVDEACS